MIKKRILFFINTLSPGGAEKVLVDLVNILPKSEYEVTILTLSADDTLSKLLDPDVIHRSIFKSYHSIDKWIKLRIFCKLIPYKWLYHCFVKRNYDYEIAYLEGFSTEVIKHSPGKNSVKIAFVHTDFSTNYPLEKIYKTDSACVKTYLSYDKVCFVSKAAKIGYEKRFGILPSGRVVHNVLNTNQIHVNSKGHCDLKFKPDCFKLVSVGRLVPQKAYDRLLSVLANVTKNFPNIELWIIGDGPGKDSLNRKLKEQGLEDVVRLIGYKQNPYPYVKQADLYVCSSISEGYSTAVTEALILGIPVLTTNVAGMKELIGDTSCGLIVESTVDGLQEGLLQVINNPQKLTDMKLAACERGKYFNQENQLQEFINLLND